jgi:tetratricopeptide (TPR) repeat protein
LLFVAITVALFVLRRRWPWLLATWCAYVLILLPVVGLIQHGGQMAADRYTYLSCIGWVILIGAGVLRLWVGEKTPRRQAVRVGVGLAAMVVVIGLAHQSRAYCADWKDSEAVWSAMIRRNPDFAMGYYNLAKANKRPCADLEANAKRNQSAGNQADAEALREEAARRYALAEANYRAAIKVYPLHPKANVDLANMMMNRQADGGWSMAEQHYLAALQGEPEFYMAHLNLGRLRMLQKRFAEAEQHFIRAEQDARRQNDAAMVIKSRDWLENARKQMSRQP